MLDPIKVTTCVVKREKREMSLSLDYFYIVIPTYNSTALSLLHSSCLRQLTKVQSVLALSMDLCQLTKLKQTGPLSIDKYFIYTSGKHLG